MKVYKKCVTPPKSKVTAAGVFQTVDIANSEQTATLQRADLLKFGVYPSQNFREASLEVVE